MYPFSISIDERVPLKQCFSNFLFHRLPYTRDTSFAPPSLLKHTQGSDVAETVASETETWLKFRYETETETRVLTFL